jgi:hypothetical protein
MNILWGSLSSCLRVVVHNLVFYFKFFSFLFRCLLLCITKHRVLLVVSGDCCSLYLGVELLLVLILVKYIITANSDI